MRYYISLNLRGQQSYMPLNFEVCKNYMFSWESIQTVPTCNFTALEVKKPNSIPLLKASFCHLYILKEISEVALQAF